MEIIEMSESDNDSDDDFDNGHDYNTSINAPGAMTQDAASSLLAFGNAFYQDAEGQRIDEAFTKIIGVECSMGSDDESIEKGSLVNKGFAESTATTLTTTSRRITLSPQQQMSQRVVNNPYKKKYSNANRTYRLSPINNNNSNANSNGTLSNSVNRRRLPTTNNKRDSIGNNNNNNNNRNASNQSKRRRLLKDPPSNTCNRNGTTTNAPPNMPTMTMATKKPVVASSTTPTTQTTSSTEPLISYIKKVQNNPSVGGITLSKTQKESMTAVTGATHNTTEYERKVIKAEERFIEILQQHAKQDVFLMAEVDTWVTFEDGFTQERRLYQTCGGIKTPLKKGLLNRALTIWTAFIENTKQKGKALQPNSHEQQVKYLFRAFADKGIQYQAKDFKSSGEFLGVLKIGWEGEAEADPTFGQKPTKPDYDEEGDIKFRKLLEDGTLNPYERARDLQMFLAMGFGRYLAYRGREEIVMSQWDQFEHSQYKTGPDKGMWKVAAKIKNGYDKGNGALRFGTTSSANYVPEIRENPDNKWCFVKLFVLYRSKCDPSQVRFFCQINPKITQPLWYYAKKPLGRDKISAMIKEVAKCAGFLSWEKFTAHRNRDRCVTQTSSSTEVTGKSSCDHARHGCEDSQGPYKHRNTVANSKLQNALLGVGVGETATEKWKHLSIGVDIKPKNQNNNKTKNIVSIENKKLIINSKQENTTSTTDLEKMPATLSTSKNNSTEETSLKRAYDSITAENNRLKNSLEKEQKRNDSEFEARKLIDMEFDTLQIKNTELQSKLDNANNDTKSTEVAKMAVEERNKHLEQQLSNQSYEKQQEQQQYEHDTNILQQQLQGKSLEMQQLQERMERETTQVKQLAHQKTLVVQQLGPLFQQKTAEAEQLRQQLITTQRYYHVKDNECNTLKQQLQEKKTELNEMSIDKRLQNLQNKHVIDMMKQTELQNNSKNNMCNMM